MKQNTTLIKELRIELRYYQTMARVDERSLRLTIAKCKAIGAQMRGLQADLTHKPRSRIM